MFGLEHLQLDTSFLALEGECPVLQAKALLEQVRFVIVDTAPGAAYIISYQEAKFLDAFHPDMTIDEWVRRTGWPCSAACPKSRLGELQTDWQKPVLVLGEDSGKLGIVTAEAMMNCLQQEKRQLVSYLDTLVETVNDAVTAVDREGRVIYWNRTAEQVYGIGKQDIIGRTIGEHFEKESIMLHQILDEGRTIRQVYHQPAPDTHVLISASPIVENNQIIGGIATEQDITRIVRLNEELYSAIPLRIEQDKPFSSIIGMGHDIKRSLEVARKFARFSTPVLLVGEPGSGKEMLAQAIHYSSERKDAAFVSLHCGAIPGGLLETELFGYQGGAFTSGEDQGKEGKLEFADGGTLFLEEVGEMPLDIQLKLSQYLRDKSFQRVGGEESIRTDARIIATTHTSLQPLMEQGLFLEDLFYQLNVMSIEIPPLRERREDIPELVQAFIREFTEHYHKPVPKVEPDVLNVLMNHDWPGNIRELRNVMERAVILCEGDTITGVHLPPGLSSKMQHAGFFADREETGTPKPHSAFQQEDHLIEEALRRAYGNKSAAAKLLGISRGTLYKKMREYDIHTE
ncbi:sigma-54 interaction domain-containing protein [Paenibacillus chitinolyticus]|uniref:sigma-54 interaction domain-containing protein n=1 Tax=Paenibacillus chitinolyticus TaxID=79263 RepID=UPI001C486920|nr:sigma 54-interacting transcriptional regulator [Paenibacillus chitinolyticus]MBV6716961.1 sigma 54-interacting transcriptional regulator [Paenibacillus chitinolyticus]